MAEYELWFFVEGKDAFFKIIIAEGRDVADLTKKIHGEGTSGFWNGATAMELVLLKIPYHTWIHVPFRICG